MKPTFFRLNKIYLINQGYIGQQISSVRPSENCYICTCHSYFSASFALLGDVKKKRSTTKNREGRYVKKELSFPFCVSFAFFIYRSAAAAAAGNHALPVLSPTRTSYIYIYIYIYIHTSNRRTIVYIEEKWVWNLIQWRILSIYRFMRMLSGENKISNQYFILLYSRRYGKYTKKVNGELVKGLYIEFFFQWSESITRSYCPCSIIIIILIEHWEWSSFVKTFSL